MERGVECEKKSPMRGPFCEMSPSSEPLLLEHVAAGEMTRFLPIRVLQKCPANINELIVAF